MRGARPEGRACQERVLMSNSRAAGRRWLIGAAMIVAGGLVPLAQGPPPAPPPPPPAAQQAPNPDAVTGRGGRGRGGPDVLAGGPQLDDPAYAAVDFSKKKPVPALAPEEERKKLILQPGYR